MDKTYTLKARSVMRPLVLNSAQRQALASASNSVEANALAPTNQA